MLPRVPVTPEPSHARSLGVYSRFGMTASSILPLWDASWRGGTVTTQRHLCNVRALLSLAAQDRENIKDGNAGITLFLWSWSYLSQTSSLCNVGDL